jgi:hypothetical protein
MTALLAELDPRLAAPRCSRPRQVIALPSCERWRRTGLVVRPRLVCAPRLAKRFCAAFGLAEQVAAKAAFASSEARLRVVLPPGRPRSGLQRYLDAPSPGYGLPARRQRARCGDLDGALAFAGAGCLRSGAPRLRQSHSSSSPPTR